MSNRRIPTLYWTANGKRKTTMKFNTLTFDANLPTVQQVNVPTNTDYKVGMKVKRNGEVQQLGPDEFTVTAQDGTVLSTDSEKTNGYVTFTQASNDDANFRQLKVAIEHGYNYNDYTERHTGQFPSTTPDPNPSIVKIKASDLGLTGYTVKAEEYKNVSRYYWRKSTPVPADLSAWSGGGYIWPQTNPLPPEQPWPQFKFTEWNGRDIYIGCPAEDTTFEGDDKEPTIRGRTAKKGVYYFFISNEEGTKWVDFVTEHTFAADDYVIISPALRFTANYYYGNCYKMTFGTPFSSNFKLNINEFKSQQGDIAETLADNPTVNVDGTYADGTTFSFDFCTK